MSFSITKLSAFEKRKFTILALKTQVSFVNKAPESVKIIFVILFKNYSTVCF
jgi:hypothetical protein